MDVVRIAMESLRDELESAIIYGRLADRYRGSSLGEKLRMIAEMEGRHAAYWSRFLKKRGVEPSNIKPNKMRITLYTILFRIIGLGFTLKLLESGEEKAIKTYIQLLESPELSNGEKEELRKILEDELMHEEEFIGEESRFREFIDHIRDMVLGMNDGLVEILSVSAGLAGAYGNPFNVAVGGLIVGIAGSLSMGVGAYVSVHAQREVRLGIFSRILLASRHVPEIFIDRVRQYMKRKGFSDELSEKIAEETVRKRELLARIIGEEEYNVREESLESPGRAGIYTGSAYIVGAILPLIPYFLLLPIPLSLPLSFIIAGLMLSATGFIIAVSGGLSIRKTMMELVAAGLGSATLTYTIGRIASLLLGIEVE